MSSTLNDAVRMAYADDIEANGSAIADTMLLGEPNALAATAISSASQLVARPGMVAVLGHTNSGASLAASRLYNEAKIVQLAPTSTAVLYSEAGAFSFRLVPSDAEQGPTLASAISKEWPVGARVAVLYVNDDYGRGLRTSFRRALDTLRYPIVTDLPHLDGQDRGTSIGADVAPVIAARPDVIVWIGRPTTLHSVLPAIRRELGNVLVLSSDATTAWTVSGNADSVLTGVQYVDYLDLDATPAARPFVERYATRFGYTPGAGEVLAYDGMRLLLRAIRDGARTGDEVRLWLDRLGKQVPAYQGISGELSFSETGDVQRPLVFKTIPAPTTR
ncbi:MAG: ABC transporter substrate-binding protein [Gemmatimonadaceae bacterium]|nr:ABC transporter substrate-binding protein [Gemmatimonadaceae bacterium]